LNGVKNLDFSRQVLVWQEILRFTQNDRSTRHKGFTPRIRVEPKIGNYIAELANIYYKGAKDEI
ncbi:MAG: hypothetical protein AAB110_02135, partial [Candidatus Desantisbacteria bacterium]